MNKKDMMPSHMVFTFQWDMDPSETSKNENKQHFFKKIIQLNKYYCKLQ